MEPSAEEGLEKFKAWRGAHPVTQESQPTHESQPSRLPSDAELSVLQVLWDQGPATIRQITDVLYPEGGDGSYATVQVLLNRLENKQHVRRDRTHHAHVFRAVTDREVLVGKRLREMAEKLCGGVMGSLLTHLVRAEELSTAERRELRALMDELDRKDRDERSRR
jgi:predicted transcriptional regulator